MTDKGFAFGDAPWLFLYPVLDQLYPGSKFIMTIRNNSWDLVNSDVKQEVRVRKKHDDAKLTSLNERTSYKVSVHEFIMLIARRYELHYNKVIKYFESQNRMNDLLIINFFDSNRDDDWKPILSFLNCDKRPKQSFPTSNSAPSKQKDEIIDQNIDLNWRDFQFSGRFENMFNLLDEFKIKYNDSIETYLFENGYYDSGGDGDSGSKSKYLNNLMKNNNDWYNRLHKMYKYQIKH